MDYLNCRGPWDVVEWQVPSGDGWTTEEEFEPGEVLFDLGPDDMLTEYDRRGCTLRRTACFFDTGAGVIDTFDPLGYHFGEAAGGFVWLYVRNGGAVIARQRMQRPPFYEL